MKPARPAARPPKPGAAAVGVLTVTLIALRADVPPDARAPALDAPAAAGGFALVPAFGSPAAAAEVPLPIPGRPRLIGQTLYAQFLWAGPTTPPPCPPLGLSASSALTITIQP